MMKFMAKKCPADDIQRLATKLKLPMSEVREIFVDQTVARCRLVMRMLLLWRERYRDLEMIILMT